MEMMVMMAGFDMPVPVIRQYISSAITLVIQLARLKGGRRRVIKISEITGLEPSPYGIRDLFGFRQTGVREGQAVGEFYATGEVPGFMERLRASGVELPASLFERRTFPAM
jgi:pilus assembly protein CpaF